MAGSRIDRLFDQSNEEYEKLTDEGVEITFGVSLSKAAIKALTQDIVWYENQTVELNGKQYTALLVSGFYDVGFDWGRFFNFEFTI
jgi:hypothetical protein